MEDTTTVTAKQPVTEHREAYGTAKTENLRDFGWWRFFWPLVVLACCVALVAIPLIFLVPLLIMSFNPQNPANQMGEPLTWLWIVMILLILSLDAIIIRGLSRALLAQAGNYR
jgi:hypothetical protein